MNDDVMLRVNGIEFGGWKEYEIAAGIERQARDFTLSVTSVWPGATDVPRLIRQGDVCEVFIGADKLLTGYVDATPISYDGKSLSVGVKGRSKTADLVDCSAIYKTGQWTKTKIERIAEDLAAPFGIEVVAESDTGIPVEHSIEQGETVYECVDRLLTMRQLLATDDAQGRMVFIRAGSGGRAGTALEYGNNILSASASLDYKDVFRDYTVQGQRPGSDQDSADDLSSRATMAYGGISRYRPLLIQQTGQVTRQICADRAKYESVLREARALETEYTVQGHRQADGTLWLPNQTVRVIDPVIGFDRELLITEVVWRKSAEGTMTEIKVAPEEGFATTPQAKTKKKSADESGAAWPDVPFVDFAGAKK